MRKDFYDKENLNGRETIFEPFGDGGRSKVIVKDLPGWGTNHRCETCGEVRSSKQKSCKITQYLDSGQCDQSSSPFFERTCR